MSVEVEKINLSFLSLRALIRIKEAITPGPNYSLGIAIASIGLSFIFHDGVACALLAGGVLYKVTTYHYFISKSHL